MLWLILIGVAIALLRNIETAAWYGLGVLLAYVLL